MEDEDTTTWLILMSSVDLLEYLQAAHGGEEPSMVLARIYLEADQREDYR